MGELIAAMRSANKGEPLPPVISKLSFDGVEFRQGELTLIAAAPGGCKTIFALTLAAGVLLPTLYFSPDTSIADISSRLISMASGQMLFEVQGNLNNGGRHSYDNLIRAKLDHIRWDFSPQLTVTDLEQEIEAFAMLWADYPHLVVVDCLRNIVIGAEDDYTGFRHAMEGLAALAKNTGSAVIVLHHLVGEYDDGRPPSLSSIEGKVSKNASLVLGLSVLRGGNEWTGPKLCVSRLKDRNGPADPSGYDRRTYLDLDLGRMRLG